MNFASIKKLKLLAIAIGLAAIGGSVYGSSVFASHSFEAGVKGDSLPDNTHIRLDGLTPFASQLKRIHSSLIE